MRYLVSITSDEYLLATNFNSIETTKEEKQAKSFTDVDAKKTLKTLKILGYDALLVKIY